MIYSLLKAFARVLPSGTFLPQVFPVGSYSCRTQLSCPSESHARKVYLKQCFPRADCATGHTASCLCLAWHTSKPSRMAHTPPAILKVEGAVTSTPLKPTGGATDHRLGCSALHSQLLTPRFIIMNLAF